MARFTLIVGTETGPDLARATAIYDPNTGRSYRSPNILRPPLQAEQFWTMSHERHRTLGQAIDDLKANAHFVHAARVNTGSATVVAIVPLDDRAAILFKQAGESWRSAGSITLLQFAEYRKEDWASFDREFDFLVELIPPTGVPSKEAREGFLEDTFGDVLDIIKVDLGVGDVFAAIDPSLPLKEILRQARAIDFHQLTTQ